MHRRSLLTRRMILGIRDSLVLTDRWADAGRGPSAGPGRVLEEHDDDKDDDDEEEEGSENEGALVTASEARDRARISRSRRRAVCAMVQLDADFKPPAFVKTQQERAEVEHAVANNSLFKGLSGKQFNVLVAAFRSLVMRQGAAVVEQGDKDAKMFYILAEGAAEVIKDDVVVQQVVPGMSFGELALLHDAPRAASVVITSGEARCWALDRQTFRQIMVVTSKKEQRTVLEFLRYVPIFKPLSEPERAHLSLAFQSRRFDKDQVIIQEGEIGDTFYIVEQGQVRIFKDRGTDNEVKLHILKQGDYFGEIALIHNERRQATVVAEEPTICLALERSTFSRMLGPIENTLRRNIEVQKQYSSMLQHAAASRHVQRKMRLGGL